MGVAVKHILTEPEVSESKEELVQELRRFAATNYANFLDSLSVKQLLVVKDLEYLCVNSSEQAAALQARQLLQSEKWPSDLKASGMDYSTFIIDFEKGCKGIRAFYYYIFDKCIERRNRNVGKNFMNRLATFAKASIRETWITTRSWQINQDIVKISFNPNSGNHNVLLPDKGQFAPDFIFTVIDAEGKSHSVYVEEKPMYLGSTVMSTVAYYAKKPRQLYGTSRLMLSLPERNLFHLHNYERNSTYIMTPLNDDGPLVYPPALKNID